MDRTKISFAEAEGKLPAILQWGKLDNRLRAALWTPFYLFLSKHMKRAFDNDCYLVSPADEIMLREFINRRHNFINEYSGYFNDRTLIETWSRFFKSQNYVELLDLITFIIRDKDCPKELAEDFSAALNRSYSPYRLSVEAKTIFPAIGDQETTSLQTELKEVFTSSFSGSRTHIQSALAALGTGEYRTSVRESIDAVESAVRDYTNDPSAILSKAIKSLISEAGIHKALADAFEKLYAYTSDEKGIRHALVFEDNERVGLDEAIFFLSACTAFVGFLSRRKHSQKTHD